MLIFPFILLIVLQSICLVVINKNLAGLEFRKYGVNYVCFNALGIGTHLFVKVPRPGDS